MTPPRTPPEPVPSDYEENPGRVRLARSVLYRHAVARDVHELVARRFIAEGLARVLDVGCGEGELARYLPDGAWVGLDNSQTMLDRAPAGGVRGEATALPFPDESFDGVAILYVLYHLSDPRLALAEAHRVLRPGGTLRSTSTSARPTLTWPGGRTASSACGVGSGGAATPTGTRRRPWPQPGSASYRSRSSTSRSCPGSSGHTSSGSRSVLWRERLLGNRRILGRRHGGRGLRLELEWIEELRRAVARRGRRYRQVDTRTETRGGRLENQRHHRGPEEGDPVMWVQDLTKDDRKEITVEH